MLRGSPFEFRTPADRGTVRIWEDGLHDAIADGQSRSLCLATRQDSLLLRIVAKEFREAEESGGDVQCGRTRRKRFWTNGFPEEDCWSWTI